MNTLAVYYLETNIICMLFMGFVLYSYMRESKGLSEAKWFIASILGVELYCLSDIFAAIFKNQTSAGSGAILWLSNTVYISLPLALAIVWKCYSLEHFRRYNVASHKYDTAEKVFFWAAVVVFVLSLTSPFTHFSFYLDELNGYHRGLGAYIVPALAYVALLIELLKSRALIALSDNLEVKTEARVMSLLPIPCILFSLLQLFFYGITTAQVGFTMGYMLVFLNRQQNSISRDDLTGLNNRRQFELGIDRLSKSSDSALVCMIDVDRFKKINDTYGHAEGDKMLKAVAELLHRVTINSELVGNYTAYRYGGDEFVILGNSVDIQSSAEMLTRVIEQEVAQWNSSKKAKYSMNLSAGIACGMLGEESISRLVKRADGKMYKIKKAKYAER